MNFLIGSDRLTGTHAPNYYLLKKKDTIENLRRLQVLSSFTSIVEFNSTWPHLLSDHNLSISISIDCSYQSCAWNSSNRMSINKLIPIDGEMCGFFDCFIFHRIDSLRHRKYQLRDSHNKQRWFDKKLQFLHSHEWYPSESYWKLSRGAFHINLQ